MEYSDVRYLKSKVSVDDRALNRAVLAAMKAELSSVECPRILEPGAGVGTMVQRLIEWDVLGRADYTLLDQDAVSLEAARDTLCSWADSFEKLPDGVLLRRGNAELTVRFEHADALDFLQRPAQQARFDAVFANAVLDLVDLRPALESLWGVLKPRGVYWFSINFDGETIFLPEHAADASILSLYHRTMDERVRDGVPSGDSKTGRRLLQLLPETGASLEAAGSSDWVVFPRSGVYPLAEEYFLRHILHTVFTALAQHPDQDARALEQWAVQRQQEVTERKLCYIAHQLDVTGRAPERRVAER